MDKDDLILRKLPVAIAYVFFAYAVFAISSAVTSYAHAQALREPGSPAPSVYELSRRIETLETQHLDTRLAVLETIQKDSESAANMARINTGISGLVLLGFGAQAYHSRRLRTRIHLPPPPTLGD